MAFDPDSGLVTKARRGDRSAFGELVTRYYDMVYGLAYGVLNNREQARDVAQDIFLKVFNDLSKFSGKSKFKTWLYRVSVNSAIDEQRRKKPTLSLDATDASDDEDRPPVIIEDRQPSPREKVAAGELQQIVKKALDELTPEHRAILVLREWQGLSYEEIAETLNIDQGTVMSRLFYARKKLGEVLKKRDALK